MRSHLAVALALTAAAACCAPRPTVGYDGPIASSEARRLLDDMQELEYVAADGRRFVPETFYVGPMPAQAPATGWTKLPHVRVAGPDGRVAVPMLTDGDVAAFLATLGVDVDERYRGPTSDAYASAWPPR